MTEKVRINNEIKAPELRVLLEDGSLLGIMPFEQALEEARARRLDLIEIAPGANPPVAKIIDLGKFQYLQSKKEKEAKAKTHKTEVKSIQVKPGTGEHDLALKAKKVSEFLSEGNRVKIDLFLRGRAKYLDKKFNEERLGRILNLVTESFKIAIGPIQGPKGPYIIIEKSKK